MNWGEFEIEIARRLQDTNVFTLIPGWYSSAASQMDALSEWRSLDRRRVIPTVAPYSTGTVQATNGSPTVTLTGGTFPSNCAGQLFAFTADGTYYDILTRDSATQITLDSTYVGTSGSSKAYKVICFKTTPPTGFDPQRAYSVTVQDSGAFYVLQYLTDRDALAYQPDETEALNKPYGYRMYQDKAIWVPAPDAAYNTVWLWKTKPTIFTTTPNTNTEFEWNESQVQVLVLWVWELGLMFLNNGMLPAVAAQRKEALAAEIRRNNGIPGGLARMKQVSILRGGRPVQRARYGEPLG